MNQTCKVCGEPAAGFHFGAFTCEGCKSFFGRSFNNVSAISECKNNGECVINKKNRTACKACRLRKCLMVGMSKSGSRYGRRSNWFKIHCLLQEQQEKQQQQHSEGMPISPSASPYSFGMPPNGFMSHKSHDEDFKTVSTPSTSPASSHISDTPSNGLDLLSKFRAGAMPPAMFDHKHHAMAQNQGLSPNKHPKDPSFYMPMTAFPGMPFPMPPTNLAQLFFSGFGAPNAAAALSHHYQDMMMAKQSPFLSMDQLMLQKQIEEERHRALMNSPPVSVSPISPPRPLSCEATTTTVSVKSPELMMAHHVAAQEGAEEEEDEDIDISGEPAMKRQKRNPVCGNHEESSNNNATKPTAATGDEQPLDLSLTKGSSSSTGGNNTGSAHLLSPTTMSTESNRQKYKGADCAATNDDEEDGDVQVDVDDQKQTAFFDYFKQTFVRENQFLKIKNNEIYSF